MNHLCIKAFADIDQVVGGGLAGPPEGHELAVSLAKPVGVHIPPEEMLQLAEPAQLGHLAVVELEPVVLLPDDRLVVTVPTLLPDVNDHGVK